MSLNSKRKRHLKWLKKKEADNTRAAIERTAHSPVDLSRYNLERTTLDTRGTHPVTLTPEEEFRRNVRTDIHPARIEPNQTYQGTIRWPDRSGNGHDLHAEPGNAPTVVNTIQEAVSIAQPGQTIVVQSGTYQEPMESRLNPVRQPLYDHAYDLAPVYLSMDIFNLMESAGISPDDMVQFIKDLIIAECERRHPTKSEVIKPAIRQLDLED